MLSLKLCLFFRWHLVHFSGLVAVFFPGSYALSSKISLTALCSDNTHQDAQGCQAAGFESRAAAHGLRDLADCSAPGPWYPHLWTGCCGGCELQHEGSQDRARMSERSVNSPCHYSHMRWLLIPGLAQVGPGRFCASDLATPVVGAGAVGWAT